MTTRVALYVRLSKEDKGGKAEGIESTAVQTADGTRAVKAEGWKLAQTFVDDGMSGTLIDRPGLAALRASAQRREIDVVAVRDLDRLGRLEPLAMMTLLNELQTSGVKVWSYRSKTYVTTAGMESIVTYVHAISAQQYVLGLRKNITEGLRARVLEGRAVKRAPLGYQIEHTAKGKYWVIDPQERKIVLRVGEIFAETGNLSTTAVRLNEAAIKSPNGKPWRLSSVSDILRRPLYRGFYKHGSVEVDHPELRIWPADLLARIDALLARPARPWSEKRRHLSTPFVRCGVCGGSMVATSSKRSRSASLVCDNQRTHGCEGIGYRAEHHVDRALLQAVLAPLTDEVWSRVRGILGEALEAQRQSDDREHRIDILRRDIQGAERRIGNLTASISEADGAAERKPLRERLRTETKRLDDLKAALAQAEASPGPTPVRAILDEAERRVSELRETLTRGGPDAIPVVEAILGGEKFRATRIPGGWRLKARISAADLYVPSSTKQKKAVKGNVTGVTVTPVVAGTPTTPTTPAPSPASPAPGAAAPATAPHVS